MLFPYAQDSQSRSRERIGTKLSSAGIGSDLMINRHSKPAILYFKQPFGLKQVHLEKETVLIQDSSILRTLCEYSNFPFGFMSRWNCKVVETGRLLARCSRSSLPEATEIRVIRKRTSKEVDCPAKVR